jgi:hypothetical protein
MTINYCTEYKTHTYRTWAMYTHAAYRLLRFSCVFLREPMRRARNSMHYIRAQYSAMPYSYQLHTIQHTQSLSSTPNDHITRLSANMIGRRSNRSGSSLDLAVADDVLTDVDSRYALHTVGVDESVLSSFSTCTRISMYEDSMFGKHVRSRQECLRRAAHLLPSSRRS